MRASIDGTFSVSGPSGGQWCGNRLTKIQLHLKKAPQWSAELLQEARFRLNVFAALAVPLSVSCGSGSAALPSRHVAAVSWPAVNGRGCVKTICRQRRQRRARRLERL